MTAREVLDGIKGRVEGKSVFTASFGDILRIAWTTYYFGADLKWHNARTGDVEDPALLELGIRAARDDWAWLTPAAPTDVARLTAAVDAALALAEEWRYKGEFGWGAWQEGQGPDPEGYVLDTAAGELRAAIENALEGE